MKNINRQRGVKFMHYFLSALSVVMAVWFVGLLFSLFVLKFAVIKEIIFLALGMFLTLSLLKIMAENNADDS